MTTSYPGALDSYTRPLGTDPLNAPSHSTVHDNVYDAIEAIETELGISPSGASATVVARLNTLDALVATKIDTAGSGLSKSGTTLTVGGTTNRITTTATTVDIASTYVGQTSITTLGTIATGTWNATTIAANKGGTGIASYTTGNYLNAATTSTLQQRTPAQVLTDIAALPLAGGTLSGFLTLNADPTANLHASTKQYVDARAGMDMKDSCRIATTANVGLTGLTAIDGVTPVASDRVLVKNQTTGSQNGIYLAASGAWTRAPMSDTSVEITSGVFCFVEEGTANANTGWFLTTPNPITLGTTALTFAQFAGPGLYTAGNGLSLTGQSFAVGGTAGRISTTATTVDIDATYVGQTSITTLGTIATGTWNATAIAANKGGTGQTVYAVGDLLYASTTSALSKLADVATGNALISGGIGVAPSWGKIGLTTHVSGTLGIGSGGTAATNAGTARLNLGAAQRGDVDASLYWPDTRAVNDLPEDRNRGLYLDFKSNATNGLSDGGTYNGVITMRKYGSGTDFSGGVVAQLAYTDNTNLWLRTGAAVGWGSWSKLWHEGNDGAASGLDADLLDGQQGTYYLDAANLTGTVASARIAGSYTGITGLGTITVGTWQGTTIAANQGGTGIASYTANNYLRAFNSTTLEQRTPAQVLTDIGASPLAGSSSIVTVGTITSGTWQGTTIAANQGGTGLASYTTGNYINAASSSALQQRTPAQVLSDIGAASSGHNHNSTYLALSGGTLTGALTLSADPTNALHAATKQYVDATFSGADVKESVRIATTANHGLSGLAAIDGVTPVAGNRVLVKNQTTGAQNGIYAAAAGAWTRATDADVSAEVTAGMFTFVTEGSTQANTGWLLSTNDPITLGTTALTFSQFTGSGDIIAGNGLDKTGNTLSVLGTSNRITVGANVDIAAAYVGQTSITTLGTISTGTWQGTTIAANQGGTGIASYTTGNYLNAVSASALQQRTPAQVLTDIAASPLAGSASLVTVGTITTGTWNATAIAANKGGTGQTVYAVGDILYASTTSALSKLAGVAAGNALISGGTNTAPSWGKIALTTHISGVLPVANGGTNIASYTTGNFIYASGTTTLAQRTPAQVLSDIAALPLAGGTLTSFLTLHADPTSVLHAATKQYVDNASVQDSAAVGGLSADQFLRSDVADTAAGAITFSALSEFNTTARFDGTPTAGTVNNPAINTVAQGTDVTTLAHTLTAPANLVVAFIHGEGTSGTRPAFDNVQYGGVAMVSAGSATNGVDRLGMYYLLAADLPATGSRNLTFSVSNSTTHELQLSVMSFNYAAQVAPTNPGLTDPTTLTATTTYNNALIVSAASTANSNAWSSGGIQTANASLASAGSTMRTGYVVGANTAGTHDVDWTIASSNRPMGRVMFFEEEQTGGSSGPAELIRFRNAANAQRWTIGTSTVESTGDAGSDLSIYAHTDAGVRATDPALKIKRSSGEVSFGDTPITPIGAIIIWPVATVPTGYLRCNGAPVSRTTYAALFALIGTTYGVGDGSTTFNVPDFQGRGPMGYGQGVGLANRTLGQQVGAEWHFLTEAEMPSHVHTLSDTIRRSATAVANPGHSLGVISGATPTPMYAVNDGAGYTIWSRNTNTKGSDNAHNNMQPTLTVNFIIRAL